MADKKGIKLVRTEKEGQTRLLVEILEEEGDFSSGKVTSDKSLDDTFSPELRELDQRFEDLCTQYTEGVQTLIESHQERIIHSLDIGREAIAYLNGLAHLPSVKKYARIIESMSPKGIMVYNYSGNLNEVTLLEKSYDLRIFFGYSGLPGYYISKADVSKAEASLILGSSRNWHRVSPNDEGIFKSSKRELYLSGFMEAAKQDLVSFKDQIKGNLEKHLKRKPDEKLIKAFLLFGMGIQRLPGIEYPTTGLFIDI